MTVPAVIVPVVPVSVVELPLAVVGGVVKSMFNTLAVTIVRNIPARATMIIVIVDVLWNAMCVPLTVVADIYFRKY